MTTTETKVDGWAREWTIGYDLDGGGYAFERRTAENGDVLVWEDPDRSYFPFGTEDFDRHRDGIEVHVDVPGTEPWPASFESPSGTMVLLASGDLYETDHECHCHGQWTDDSEEDWEYTGDTTDDPYPECDRCEGDGYVTSPGGRYAWYALAEPPREEELRALIRDLRASILDDDRASDDDDEPSIALTIGWTPANATWGWQTGDNSFTGGAYGHPVWATATVYRDSVPSNVAHDLRDELRDTDRQ